MDIHRIIALVRKWAWLVVLGGLLGVVGGYVYTQYQPEVYQTTTNILVSRAAEDREMDYISITSDMQLAKTYTRLIMTESVLKAVSEHLGFRVTKDQISVKQAPDMLILDITVKDGDPQRAQDIANTLIEVFIERNEAMQTSRFIQAEENLQLQIEQIELQIATIQDEMTQVSEENLKNVQQQVEAQIAALDPEIKAIREELPSLSGYTLQEKMDYLQLLETRYDLYQQAYQQILILGQAPFSGNQSMRQAQLQTTLSLYQEIYSNLLNNYESTRLARLKSTTNVVQIDEAPLPITPIQPRPTQNILLGLVLGIALTGGIAFLVEYLDDTLKSPEDVAKALRLPTVGMIGEMDRNSKDETAFYVSEEPRSPVAEAFRTLRTNLEFAAVDKPLRTILVTSSGPTEGKTTTAINLATVMAQGGKKVVLLDADLRRPSIHQKLKLPNMDGLTDLFRHTMPVLPNYATWGTPPITVVTSGEIPPNPTELLASTRMDHILEMLIEEHDVIILDSPPSIVTDPVVLAAKVDGVLLIVEPGKTKVEAAQAMLEQLHRSGARIIGVVLNPISRKQSYYYGKYRYASYYYYSHGYEKPNGKSGRNGNDGHRKTDVKREQVAEEAEKSRLFFTNKK